MNITFSFDPLDAEDLMCAANCLGLLGGTVIAQKKVDVAQAVALPADFPETPAAAAPPVAAVSLLPTAASTGPIAPTTAASTGPIAPTAASPSDLLLAPPAPAADPLALLSADAAAASPPSSLSPASPIAPLTSTTTKSPSDDVLSGVLLAGGQLPTEFVVYGPDGLSIGSYASEKDAVSVYQHQVGQAGPAEVEKLAEHNKTLYDRVDRGGKVSMSRAYSKRKEEIAATLAAINGEAAVVATPAAEGERAPLTHDDFLLRFSALANKVGAQAANAVVAVYGELGATNHKDLAADLYWKAIDAMQQVIDNKGK